MWLDTKDAWSCDRNPPNFTLDLVTDHSANKRTTSVIGNYKVLCCNSSSCVRLFIFHTLPDIRGLSVALCERQPKITSPEFSTTTRERIYSHPQTDCFVVSQLLSVVRHVGRWKLGSKPVRLYVRLSIRSLGQQVYHVGLGVLRTLIDKIRENGFELTKKRSRRYPAKIITDADYADDIAILANTPN